jgi:hypothetical protein
MKSHRLYDFVWLALGKTFSSHSQCQQWTKDLKYQDWTWCHHPQIHLIYNLKHSPPQFCFTIYIYIYIYVYVYIYIYVYMCKYVYIYIRIYIAIWRNLRPKMNRSTIFRVSQQGLFFGGRNYGFVHVHLWLLSKPSSIGDFVSGMPHHSYILPTPYMLFLYPQVWLVNLTHMFMYIYNYIYRYHI